MSDIQALFNSTTNLPMLPKVVQELLRLLDEDDPDTKEVIQKINRDPVIAAKVLRLANTAHYGAARQVKTLEDALSVIGFAKLSTLVIASGVSESFSNVPNMNLPLFWKRSFVCAAISRHMAIELNQLINTRYQPELLYLGGLLHGIGQLVMHLFFPKAQKAMLMADLAQSAVERKRIEQAELGVDHCLVGQELTRRWLLPPEIRRMVRHYAEPKNTEADSSASVVHFAAHIALDLLLNKKPLLILKEIDSPLSTILAPTNEIWESRFETYSSFLSEAEAFV
jgi:HD-like signal output (HDOD) protein